MAISFNRKKINDHLSSETYDEVLDVKKLGKLTAVIVQGSDIVRYAYHFIRTLKKVEENGKEKNKIVSEPHLCLKDEGLCPICDFIENLMKNDEIDDDEIVAIVGEGRNIEEIPKGEVIGSKGYNNMNSWKANYSFLINVINYKEQEKQQALRLTPGLMRKLNSLIENFIEQAEEDGEDVTLYDPFDQGEIVFNFVYDKDADNNNRYQVYTLSNKKYNNTIYDIMDDELIDKTKLFKKADINNMVKAINNILLDEFYIEGYEEKDSKKENNDETNDKKELKTRRNLKRNNDKEDNNESSKRTRRVNKNNNEENEENEEKTSRRTRRVNKNNNEENEEKTSRRTRNNQRERVNNKNTSNKRYEKSKSEELLECPNCAYEVDVDENECPECGEDLTV